MARKENQKTPIIVSRYLYTEDAFTGTLVGSPAWFTWLQQGLTFYYQSPPLSFTARCEQRRHGYFWYAFRRRNGHLYKHYLGRHSDLTLEQLSTVAQALAVVSSTPDKLPASGL
jgi:hypothetical protein